MIKWKINGETVTREEWDAQKRADFDFDGTCPIGTVAYSDSQPMISEALGCMKSQVGEMRDNIKKRNIRGVRVLDSGQLEITSRQGRKELNAMRGTCDLEGGYGD